MSVTDIVDHTRRVDNAVRVNSDVLDAEVHADRVGGFDRVWFVDIAGRGKVEDALSKRQVGCSLPGGHEVFLARPADKRYPDSARKRPDRYRGI